MYMYQNEHDIDNNMVHVHVTHALADLTMVSSRQWSKQSPHQVLSLLWILYELRDFSMGFVLWLECSASRHINLWENYLLLGFL